MYVFEIWLKCGTDKKLNITERAGLVFQEIRDALSIDESDKENVDLAELQSRIIYICRKITDIW